MNQKAPRRRGKAAPAGGQTGAEPMLRVEQVAERLDVTETTVRRWLRAGKLAGSRPGGTKAGWRIPASEVDRLLRPRRRGDDGEAT